jgi:hypothetical protein
LYYIGEVPRSFSCVTAQRYARKTVQGWSGKRADNLVRWSPVFRGQAWRRVRLARKTVADQVWEVKAAQLQHKRRIGRTFPASMSRGLGLLGPA